MDESQAGPVDGNEVSNDPADARPPHSEPVLVRFNPGTKGFDFEPETVVMDRPGKIVILKDPPQNRTWNLETVTIVDPDRQFTIEATSGVAIIVDDRHTTRKTYCYTVTVTDTNGGTHISPDPHIRNSNPTTGEPPGD